MTSVLVVDDDAAFRRLALRALSEADLSVIGEADSIESALVAAAELRPQAVLVDVGLPDGDGTALARRLAALPWRPRVVLTSIDADAVSPHELERDDIHGFAPKETLLNAGVRLLAGLDPP